MKTHEISRFWDFCLILGEFDDFSKKNLRTKFQTKISPRKNNIFLFNFFVIKIYIEIYPLQLIRGEAARNNHFRHCLKSKIHEIAWNIKSNLVLLYQVSYLVAFTSRNIRHRNNRLFGDDRILGYLAGVPKLVYGGNPLVKLGKFCI